MRLTIKVKLAPNPVEYTALSATLELCNQVANELSEYAFTANIKRKFDLHHARYARAKEMGLAAQAAVRTISKVSDAYATQQGLIKNGVLKGKRLKKATSKTHPVQE